MEFWSKGLGRQTVDLYLGKAETAKSGDMLYLKGTMEEPVLWDYIMPLSGDDVADFFALMKDPKIVEFIHQSPDRWKIYGFMITGGVRLAWLIAKALVLSFFRKIDPAQEPVIVVPPPIERKARRFSSRRNREAEETASAIPDIDAVEAEIAAAEQKLAAGGG